MFCLDDFIKFEEQHNLFNLKYKGVAYWQFIRYNIFLETLYGDAFKEAHPDLAKKRTLHQNLSYFPYIFQQFRHFFDLMHYDFFISDSYIKRNVAGRMINPYLQFLSDNYSFACKYNTVFSGNWVDESSEISNNALAEFAWTPVYVAVKCLQKFGTASLSDLKEILTLFNETFNCKINASQYMNAAIQAAYKHKVLKCYYKYILKGKYSAYITEESYNTYNYAIIAAARECGIPTIELQHGTIGRYHVAYNFCGNVPKSCSYFPDYLFTFGDYWSQTARIPSYSTAISVGSPLMDDSRNAFDKNIKDEKTVIFISNGLIGVAMSKLAIQFAHIAIPQGYKVIYKFHPNERLTWRERYPWLVSTNIQIEDRSINVHELLATSQHIVSVASTVLFEALAFSCNVYIWDYQMNQAAEDFIRQGVTPMFSDASDLLCFIKQSKPVNQSDIASYLYKPNSLKSIENILTQIVEQKEGEELQI